MGVLSSTSPKGCGGDRGYRCLLNPEGLRTFQVRVKETDLWIAAERDLSREALEEVLRLRGQLEAYILENPDFLESLHPLPLDPLAPPVVRLMLEVAQKAGVGPMAAVAGALSEFVGRRLLEFSNEVVVENGGDLFIRSFHPRRVLLYAGDSPLSMKLAIEIPPGEAVGVCTSSATVGHSLSFGKADAVCVISPSSALADAVATMLGNMVRAPEDIPKALKRAQGIDGVEGAVIVLGGKLGVWGKYELREA